MVNDADTWAAPVASSWMVPSFVFPSEKVTVPVGIVVRGVPVVLVTYWLTVAVKVTD